MFSGSLFRFSVRSQQPFISAGRTFQIVGYNNILFQSSFNDSINYSSLYVKYM